MSAQQACRCAEIQAADPARHFKGCPLREPLPPGKQAAIDAAAASETGDHWTRVETMVATATPRGQALARALLDVRETIAGLLAADLSLGEVGPKLLGLQRVGAAVIPPVTETSRAEAQALVGRFGHVLRAMPNAPGHVFCDRCGSDRREGMPPEAIGDSLCTFRLLDELDRLERRAHEDDAAIRSWRRGAR